MSNLSQQEIANYFQLIDTDQSGKISTEEVAAFLEKKYGATVDQNQLQQVLSQYDVDKDGEVDLEEFKSCVVAFFQRQQ